MRSHSPKNDEIYYEAYSACCFAWLSVMLSYAPMVWEKDKAWGKMTFRERIINGLENFIDLASEKQTYPALLEVSRVALDKFWNLWEMEGKGKMPVYQGLIKQ